MSQNQKRIKPYLGKLASSLLLCGVTLAAHASDGNEPPKNPYLADSAWPMSHRTSYVQGSSPLRGPESAADLNNVEHRSPGLVNITQAMSAPYADGTIVNWTSSTNSVYKSTVSTGRIQIIDRVAKKLNGVSGIGISGAYTVLDHENTFFVPGQASITAYRDSIEGDAFSPIAKVAEFTVPAESLRESGEGIVGINMTYDGYLVLATKQGTIAVLSRDFSEYQYVQLGESAEEVSNSFAVDEDGGIYVVTAKKMYRVQWTGTELSLDPATGAWSADYEIGADVQVPGRLGPGSGSTPSLMGIDGQDKFVVITDGQAVTNLVLFWRDEIPAGWQPIAPGKDIRIAAEMPVNYGDAERPYAMSEQSVLVRGYGAVVVSNDYGFTAPNTGSELLGKLLSGLVVLFSNSKSVAPYGVQKFEWDPATQTLNSAWVNNEISCPNGIPTMSAVSNLMYCVGQRDAVWNVEALDWDTGASVFYKPMKNKFTHNSFYAATQIGPNRDIWSGSFSGLFKLEKK